MNQATVLTLGHAPEVVVKAVQARASIGTAFFGPSPLEVRASVCGPGDGRARVHAPGARALAWRSVLSLSKRFRPLCLRLGPQIEMAELLQERIPSMERTRFCSSGTEAVMNAHREDYGTVFLLCFHGLSI
eukprot:SAG22_NODE_516_length_9563_cov_29.476965_9_plen_131_part_00